MQQNTIKVGYQANCSSDQSICLWRRERHSAREKRWGTFNTGYAIGIIKQKYF